jgi:Zn-finger nucleic acid-binding protein
MTQAAVCLSCGGAVHPASRGDAQAPGACRCPSSPKEAERVECPSCGGSILVGVRACPYCSSTVATRRCPACLGWNLAGAAHCQLCGRPLPAEAEAEVASGYGCPRCQSQLVARQYAETSVDECDQCGGLFLAPATMDRVTQARDLPTGLRLALPKRQARREAAVKYVHCPVCRKLMNRQAFGRISGVVVDVCKSHGVWFDAGELSEVIQFVENGGLERARERELEELAERERRLRSRALEVEAGQSLGFEVGSLGLQLAARERPTRSVEILRFIADLWR